MKLTDKNAILEALRAGREIRHIALSTNADRDSRIQEIVELARGRGVRVGTVKPQGRGRGMSVPPVSADCADFAYATLDDIVIASKKSERGAVVLALDHVQDPQNLGAILRTAAAAGACGVIIQNRRACQVTAAAYETSCGGAERVPVACVPNLVRALEQLKHNDFWITGADERAEQSVHDADMAPPLALVLGAEGSGLSRLVRESCDFLIRIPTDPGFPGLNVSVAAGVLLFEAVRRRQSPPT